MPPKTSRYADAWGIRKLTSHALRNLRQDRQPRALWQQKDAKTRKNTRIYLHIIRMHNTCTARTVQYACLLEFRASNVVNLEMRCISIILCKCNFQPFLSPGSFGISFLSMCGLGTWARQLQLHFLLQYLFPFLKLWIMRMRTVCRSAMLIMCYTVFFGSICSLSLFLLKQSVGFPSPLVYICNYVCFVVVC